MSDERDYDLAVFEDFVHAVRRMQPSSVHPRVSHVNVNGMYCVKCGGHRRMAVVPVHWPERSHYDSDSAEVQWRDMFPGPATFLITCLQCRTKHTALVHLGPEGFELATFSVKRGGFTTPHTPESVSYYLDQAHRAESVDCMSAAASMYRSALEMLLYDQGYTQRMLGPKVMALLQDQKPPPWREHIDPDYLDALKKIGDGAMRPNDGNIEQQRVLDRELLGLLRAVFEELLEVIYERPVADAARKAKLILAGQSLTAPESSTRRYPLKSKP